MDIEEFSKLESGLKMAIGNNKFETVVGEISDIVYKNNLDVRQSRILCKVVE